MWPGIVFDNIYILTLRRRRLERKIMVGHSPPVYSSPQRGFAALTWRWLFINNGVLMVAASGIRSMASQNSGSLLACLYYEPA